jgi:hypothetical protein
MVSSDERYRQFHPMSNFECFWCIHITAEDYFAIYRDDGGPVD